jgi:hypothetical protein
LFNKVFIINISNDPIFSHNLTLLTYIFDIEGREFIILIFGYYEEEYCNIFLEYFVELLIAVDMAC